MHTYASVRAVLAHVRAAHRRAGIGSYNVATGDYAIPGGYVEVEHQTARDGTSVLLGCYRYRVLRDAWSQWRAV